MFGQACPLVFPAPKKLLTPLWLMKTELYTTRHLYEVGMILYHVIRHSCSRCKEITKSEIIIPMYKLNQLNTVEQNNEMA